MESITLNNGVDMPLLGLGLYQLHGKACEECVLAALELGYRLFDTAQMYGNEKKLGNVVRQCEVSRKELFITTKLYRPSTSYARAKKAIEESLEASRLQHTAVVDFLIPSIRLPNCSQMQL